VQSIQLPTTTVSSRSLGEILLLTRFVTTVLTFGAGVQWFEAYEAAKRHNRVIVGGLSAGGSVGAAGGWFQGGGHGALAPNYGLGNAERPLIQPSVYLIRLFL
jgi:hypothetical protein